jgi:hypothetical protein
VVSWASGV